MGTGVGLKIVLKKEIAILTGLRIEVRIRIGIVTRNRNWQELNLYNLLI